MRSLVACSALLIAACGSSAGHGQLLTDAGANCAYPISSPHFDCVRSKCQSQLAACFGDHWEDGYYSDLCFDYVVCKCGCDPTALACGINCSQRASADCTTCIQQVVICSAGCP